MVLLHKQKINTHTHTIHLGASCNYYYMLNIKMVEIPLKIIQNISKLFQWKFKGTCYWFAIVCYGYENPKRFMPT